MDIFLMLRSCLETFNESNLNLKIYKMEIWGTRWAFCRPTLQNSLRKIRFVEQNNYRGPKGAFAYDFLG